VVFARIEFVQSPYLVQGAVCSYYVDNHVSNDGDGSWSLPWKNINSHVGDLRPGDTMCARGDISGAGRVYEVTEISLDSTGGLVRDGTLGSPITVRTYPDERVILKNVGSGSILYFRGTNYWVFDGFIMDNNGHGSRAIRIVHGASHNVLRNNEIYNGSNDGIAFFDATMLAM